MRRSERHPRPRAPPRRRGGGRRARAGAAAAPRARRPRATPSRRAARRPRRGRGSRPRRGRCRRGRRGLPAGTKARKPDVGSRRRETSSQTATVTPPAKSVARGGEGRLDAGVERQVPDEVVADGEDDRRRERVGEPDPLHVLGPARLADEQDPARDDQDRPGDHARLRRLVQEHQRDRDREERRRADGDRRSRRAGVAHGQGEEELRAARPEHAGEQERPGPGEVDLARRDEGQRHEQAPPRSCRTAPASASGSRASANLSATVIEPKSAADASASTTASTIQRYNDYDPPPWTIRAYASWPS